jgi:hypothetical protein
MTHTIWLSTPTGTPSAIIDNIIRLDYRRSLNESGRYVAQNVRNELPLRCIAPADALPLHLLARDSRLQLWRTRSTNGALLRSQSPVTEATWLVRQVRTLASTDGQRLVEIGAVPAIDLLNDRIVAYPANRAQASKTGPADDLMKAIVRENFGALATDSRRDVSNWLKVAPDLGRAPVVSKSFARRTVLDVLQELAEASAEAGTPLYFDIVTPAPAIMEFRTYAGTRGIDHTFPGGVQPVVLSPETGTLLEAERGFDYEDEYTVVYAGGQGAENERRIATVSDPARISGSPFGWRERRIDVRHIRDTTDLLAEAQAALVAGRPRRTFRATIRSTPGAAYGLHWKWGDRVTAVVEDEIFACTIDELAVTVTAAGETIRARLRADEDDAATSTRLSRLTTPETEATYQQVQRGTLPANSSLRLPAEGHLLVYGRYVIAGQVDLAAGSRLVVLT